jgi:hypothetical protein
MTRQDISADPIHGELETTGNLTGKAMYDFLLPDDLQQGNTAFGEITVPPGFEAKQGGKNGIYLHIPYIPVFKELNIRFRVEAGNGSTEYLINKTDNSRWFAVYRGTETEEKRTIRLSEFYELNENGYFNLVIKEGYLLVFSGDETDFEIKPALKQNEIFLLKTLSGNLYQHPTTGVGLIDFLHGNFEHTGLADKLQKEFEQDNMIINNAYMDSITGELYLDVMEKDG